MRSDFWELVCKGASHRYIKREKNKIPPPNWKYWYKLASGKIVTSDSVHEGAKFKYGKDKEAGHFQVMSGPDSEGKYTFKHDETGETLHLTPEAMANLIHSHHGIKEKEPVKAKPKKEKAEPKKKQKEKKLPQTIEQLKQDWLDALSSLFETKEGYLISQELTQAVDDAEKTGTLFNVKEKVKSIKTKIKKEKAEAKAIEESEKNMTRLDKVRSVHDRLLKKYEIPLDGTLKEQFEALEKKDPLAYQDAYNALDEWVVGSNPIDTYKTQDMRSASYFRLASVFLGNSTWDDEKEKLLSIYNHANNPGWLTLDDAVTRIKTPGTPEFRIVEMLIAKQAIWINQYKKQKGKDTVTLVRGVSEIPTSIVDQYKKGNLSQTAAASWTTDIATAKMFSGMHSGSYIFEVEIPLENCLTGWHSDIDLASEFEVIVGSLEDAKSVKVMRPTKKLDTSFKIPKVVHGTETIYSKAITFFGRKEGFFMKGTDNNNKEKPLTTIEGVGSIDWWDEWKKFNREKKNQTGTTKKVVKKSGFTIKRER